ncbi:hypothetical protein [Rhizobium oryziradicis]|uniref:Uncharacterized protein n=1 Tax=Rhizobium oryziradicis TaxID=1867956 RepID=A0A1Q8ZRF4_9HYPH|nr:hypothetical protein [Rhizobium oryziradicis]OLP44636.1 hypothetical protein BJF95_09045 [Rhizobium oryziradicis]
MIVNATGYDSKNKKTLICGVYISPKGITTFGWLNQEGFFGGGNFMDPIDDPKVFGDWTDKSGNDITIKPGESGRYVVIEGDATIGPSDNPRTGFISGPAFIGDGGKAAGYTDSHYDGAAPASTKSSEDESGCRVRLRYSGYYLFVDDNEECGGQGVSFSGIYLKKSAKK